MKNFILLTLLCSALQILGQQTYFTTGEGSGDYSDPASWTLTQGSKTPAGPPSAYDNLVINHYISHYAGRNYTHYGNITIGTNGTYEALTGIVNSGPYIFAGNLFKVDGTLMTIDDFHHQEEGSNGEGVLIFSHTSLVYINGDLVLNGSGQAVMNNVSCGAGQTVNDFCFKGPGSRVCGNGTFIVPEKIRAWNDLGQEITGEGLQAHIETLICDGFTFYKSTEACKQTTQVITGRGQFGIESEIILFNAKLESGFMHFDWSVNRDQMNETFVIEKSYDRNVFEVVETISGERKTDAIATYELTSDVAVEEKVYFRLKKVSVTGDILYSSLIEMNIQQQIKTAFQISPNPTNSNTIQVKANGFHNSSSVILSIRTLLGQEMHRESIMVDGEGNLIQTVNHNLRRGTYLVVLSSARHQVTQRLQVL
ncbi:MAG: T9SS type A sorting domain-containing protein [Bacteroidetes bacterium]|nr:T9SS type A sorting domain-containing protein [Bacteroidota bacterium]